MSSALAFDSASPWEGPTAGSDDPRLRRMRRAGGVVASVYIRGNPGGYRHANAADVQRLRAAGFGVLPNWESTADYFRTATLAQARAAGVEAAAALRDLGFPLDGTIDVPFSFDYQMSPASYPAEAAKLAAAQEGLGTVARATAYAQSGFIDYLGANGYGDRVHWLMASTWGLPYAPTSPHVGLVQSHDAAGNWLDSPVPATDVNTVTQPGRVGAWWPDGSTYTVKEGGAVALSDQDVARIAAAVWAHTRTPVDGKEPRRMDVECANAQARAFEAAQAAEAALAQVKTVVQVLGTPKTGIAARVASLQAAVDALAAAVRAVDADVLAVPAKAVTVDAGAVTAAVVQAVEGLTFRAAQ